MHRPGCGRTSPAPRPRPTAWKTPEHRLDHLHTPRQQLLGGSPHQPLQRRGRQQILTVHHVVHSRPPRARRHPERPVELHPYPHTCPRPSPRRPVPVHGSTEPSHPRRHITCPFLIRSVRRPPPRDPQGLPQRDPRGGFRRPSPRRRPRLRQERPDRGQMPDPRRHRGGRHQPALPHRGRECGTVAGRDPRQCGQFRRRSP